MRKIIFLATILCCLFGCTVECELSEDLVKLLGQYNCEEYVCEDVLDPVCVDEYYCEKYNFNCNKEICETIYEDCIDTITFNIFDFDPVYWDLFCTTTDLTICLDETFEEYDDVVASCSNVECNQTNVVRDIKLERCLSSTIEGTPYDNIVHGREEFGGGNTVEGKTIWIGMLTENYLNSDYDASEYKYFVLENTIKDIEGHGEETLTNVTAYYFNFVDSNTIEGVYRWFSSLLLVGGEKSFKGTRVNMM